MGKHRSTPKNSKRAANAVLFTNDIGSDIDIVTDITSENTPIAVDTTVNTAIGTAISATAGPIIGTAASYMSLCHLDEPLLLDCGETLHNITIAYETFGTLNDARTNTVWICHALTGNSHVAQGDTDIPGWWDDMVGPGKAIDTNTYFVICANVLGGCSGTTGPSSINPATGKRFARTFPLVTIDDMVRTHIRLLDTLDIEKVCAVIGGSMGGMQALSWAAHFPERTHAIIADATTPQLSAQAIAFNEVGRRAILDDPAFANGDYYDTGNEPHAGLAIARMIGHITYLSDESMWEKFGRRLRDRERFAFDFVREFEVETYLAHQGKRFIERFDANSYLLMTKATDYFDLAKESLEVALKNAPRRFLVLSFTSDWLFPTYQAKALTRALLHLGKHVTFAELQSSYGHDAFLLEFDAQAPLFADFLHNAHTSLVAEVTDVGALAKQPSAMPKRRDFALITDLVTSGSRILDVGCGDGSLLALLRNADDVQIQGMDRAFENVAACVQKDVPVVQANVDTELAQFSDNQFDVAVLSQTLQVLSRPAVVVREMLRIAPTVIVTFPNFAHWSARAHLALRGKMPVSKSLPYSWDETPNIHHTTLHDFRSFIASLGGEVASEIPYRTNRLGEMHVVRIAPNLRADTVAAVVTRSAVSAVK